MQRKLLTNGNVFRRTDKRWGGTIWYMDEQGERKRKCFSGTTKQEVKDKLTAYISEFKAAVQDSQDDQRDENNCFFIHQLLISGDVF